MAANVPSSHSGIRPRPEKWDEALEVCRQRLSRQDLEYLDQIPTCDSLIQKLNASSLEDSYIHRLRSPLQSIQAFLTVVTFVLGQNLVKTALVWGVMSLVIEAARQTEKGVSETVEMLAELGHDLQIFQIYERTFDDKLPIGEDLLAIFVEIITFWCRAVGYLRRNKFATVSQVSWPKFRQGFEESCAHIKKKSQQIKERLDTIASTQPPIQASLLQELSRLGVLDKGPQPATKDVTQASRNPCHSIPFPSNPNFFGRDDILGHVRHALPAVSSRLCSYALWGTGGAGKTQIALRFAYEMHEEKGLTVLWVNCETAISIDTSFQDIVAKLKLPSSRKGEASAVNRFAVLEWLRVTDVQWLLVLDNVEDIDLARRAWPVASHGNILVTSRNPIVSIDPAASGNEVGFLTDDEGSDLILKLVGKSSYLPEEKESAAELSNKLSGLALALTVMAFQIKLRRMTIQNFTRLYENNPERLHREKRGISAYYNHSLQECWRSAFEYLGDSAECILGMCSLLAADKIPETLFKLIKGKEAPVAASFIQQEIEVEDALDELLSLSLIRRDPATETISVHRLIQDQFRLYMPLQLRRSLFKSVYSLIAVRIPPYDNGKSFRSQWHIFQQYIEHILALASYEEQYDFTQSDEDGEEILLSLLCSATWYLFESGKWTEQKRAFKVASKLCRNKKSLTYAALLTAQGCMDVERGHAEEAVDSLKEAMNIRQDLLPETHLENANSIGNLANALMQTMREGAAEEAVTMFQEALKINVRVAEADPKEGNRLLHIRHCSLSRSLRVVKRFDEALHHANEARRFSIETFGPNNHFEASANYYAGNIHWDMGDVNSAYKFWKMAEEVFASIDNKHPSYLGAKLKLAWVSMRRGQIDEAIGSIHELIIVGKLREHIKGDKGETARYMRTLADAYKMKGDMEKAEEARATADKYRKDIQGEQGSQFPDDDQSYCLMTFSAFW